MFFARQKVNHVRPCVGGFEGEKILPTCIWHIGHGLCAFAALGVDHDAALPSRVCQAVAVGFAWRAMVINAVARRVEGKRLRKNNCAALASTEKAGCRFWL